MKIAEALASPIALRIGWRLWWFSPLTLSDLAMYESNYPVGDIGAEGLRFLAWLSLRKCHPKVGRFCVRYLMRRRFRLKIRRVGWRLGLVRGSIYITSAKEGFLDLLLTLNPWAMKDGEDAAKAVAKDGGNYESIFQWIAQTYRWPADIVGDLSPAQLEMYTDVGDGKAHFSTREQAHAFLAERDGKDG